jgi:hypothetical protein
MLFIILHIWNTWVNGDLLKGYLLLLFKTRAG